MYSEAFVLLRLLAFFWQNPTRFQLSQTYSWTLPKAQIQLDSTRHATICPLVSCQEETRHNVSSLFQHGRRRSDDDRLCWFSILCSGRTRPEYKPAKIRSVDTRIFDQKHFWRVCRHARHNKTFRAQQIFLRQNALVWTQAKRVHAAWLTCDIQERSCFGRQSQPVRRPTRVPAGVADVHRREHETSVGVDGRATGLRQHVAVVQPLVRHVVRKRFRLAAEFDSTSFQRGRVERPHHDVCVAWIHTCISDTNTVAYAFFLLSLFTMW